MAPLLNAATGQFDASVMNGFAVLICVDSSVKMMGIRNDGKVVVSANHTLLDTGKNTLWGKDVQPVIKPPRKR